MRPIVITFTLLAVLLLGSLPTYSLTVDIAGYGYTGEVTVGTSSSAGASYSVADAVLIPRDGSQVYLGIDSNIVQQTENPVPGYSTGTYTLDVASVAKSLGEFNLDNSYTVTAQAGRYVEARYKNEPGAVFDLQFAGDVGESYAEVLTTITDSSRIYGSFSLSEWSGTWYGNPGFNDWDVFAGIREAGSSTFLATGNPGGWSWGGVFDLGLDPSKTYEIAQYIHFGELSYDSTIRFVEGVNNYRWLGDGGNVQTLFWLDDDIPTTATPVPEPSSALMVCIALSFSVLTASRLKKKRAGKLGLEAATSGTPFDDADQNLGI